MFDEIKKHRDLGTYARNKLATGRPRKFVFSLNRTVFFDVNAIKRVFEINSVLGSRAHGGDAFEWRVEIFFQNDVFSRQPLYNACDVAVSLKP